MGGSARSDDGAPRTARSRLAGPTAEPQHRADLDRDCARRADHIPPAVAKHGVSGDGGHVVPPHVAKLASLWVRLSTVQFDDDVPIAISDVAVPATASTSPLRLVTSAGR